MPSTNKDKYAYKNEGFQREENGSVNESSSVSIPSFYQKNEFWCGKNNVFPPTAPSIDSNTSDDSWNATPQEETHSDENPDTSEDEERETWDSPMEFLLSCISMSVGLGNVWRFPGVAARNGGGAFLIPYIVVLLFIGRPLYYLEMCLGQFSRFGQVKVWAMVPLFKGVGYGSLTAVVCTCSYYCSLMAVTVYYFFASFSAQLPWSVCHEDVYGNDTCAMESTQGRLAELYYDRIVFPQRENIVDGLGKIHYKLALCLALSWIIIFLSLVKGVRSSGKVAYFTAIFPYIVLFILLIRGVTLPGAWEGLKYFMTPQWDKLTEPKIWFAAVEQCFFSLGIGFGPVIMFSSYSDFRQNIYKDVLVISIMDTFTSLLAGCTVFSVMGYLVEKYDMDITKIQGGPGLAFILYPQAIAEFDWVPQLFAVLFFLMLFTLGIGSANSLCGGIITIVCDKFPNYKRWLVTSIVCLAGCSLGLLYVTEGGIFMLNLVDHYGAGFIVYGMAMLECAGVAYIYGLSNFGSDVEFMLNRKVGVYWRICWSLIIPVGLCVNLVYYLASEDEFTSGGIEYPKIATISGWLLTAFAAALIPIWAIHAVVTQKSKSLKEKFLMSIQPTHRWGPQKVALRREWLQFRSDHESRRGRMSLFSKAVNTIFG